MKSTTDTTVIAESITIEGVVSGADDVRVSGVVNGEIRVDGRVSIEQSALVAAKVRGGSVHIVGRVEGNVSASDLVELETEARMTGDIKAPRILIADGARFKGNVDMENKAAHGEIQSEIH